MLRSWLGGSREAGSTQSLGSLDELQALEDAMQAATFIMNDDLVTAEARLSEGNSAFHKLGHALASFLRAVLGFERDVMREASERLAEAELSATENLHRAKRHPNSSRSSAYSPGTEYALCQAEAQIMGAVVAVLTESLGESIKGFYKLRKAYLTLEAIMQEEKTYLESAAAPTIAQQHSEVASTVDSDGSSDDMDEFVDAKENLPGEGQAQSNEVMKSKMPAEDGERTLPGGQKVELTDGGPDLTQSLRRLSSHFSEGPDAALFGSNQIDLFIHSGTNTCFGILLIVLSLIPPSFSTLARIAGFKGDHKRGLELLWQAAKFQNNINGAFAGLVLLGYYNGMLGFSDILPSSGKGSYPKQRCKDLLREFRQRYPESRLWVLEEARMMSQEKRLDDAVKMLSTLPESKLKQVLALQWFELSLSNMYLHNYEACSSGFLKMVELNKWSHGLYYYVAGCAQVELYRQKADVDHAAAAKHAERATTLLRKVPDHVGKRRIMAKQLPFDVFVSRKIQKWEQRSKDLKVRFVDAVGVSPIEEMIYFWNGYKRMRPEQLQVSLQNLSGSILAGNPAAPPEGLDEQAILWILKSAVLRNLGKTAEAKQLLMDNVMHHEWSLFKGGLKDNWTAPVARYEMAVNHWQDYGRSKEPHLLEDCQKRLEEVANWEAFDLDARFGVRIATARETVKKELSSISPP